MPEMDGYQATAVIRQDFPFEELPIIAMTAHAMAGDREKCLEAGMNDYVSKPIDPDRLFDSLVKWLEPSEISPERNEVPNDVQDGEPQRAVSDGGGSPPDHPLWELPGFDVQAALNRLRGNDPLFAKLLGDFASQNDGAAAEIRDKIDSGDFSAAKHLAHSVKGAAGNLSATDLFEATRDLELQMERVLEGGGVEESQDVVRDSCDRFSAVLKRTLATIRAATPEVPEEEGSEGTALDAELASRVADRIDDMLSSGDLTQAELLLRTLPSDSRYARRISELADNFDLAGLENLAEELRSAAK